MVPTHDQSLYVMAHLTSWRASNAAGIAGFKRRKRRINDKGEFEGWAEADRQLLDVRRRSAERRGRRLLQKVGKSLGKDGERKLRLHLTASRISHFRQ
jgi:hypothetical protein